MGANALTAGTAVLPWFGHLSKQESLNLVINNCFAVYPCEIFLTGYYYNLINKKSTMEKKDFLDWVENIG